MKKTFTLFILSVITSAAFAFPPQTKLSISSLSNYSLKIVIDGNSYNYDKSKNDAEFVLSNLSPGQHAVKIYRQVSRGRRNIFSNNDNNNMQVIYSSNVYLRSQYHTDIVINRFGKVFTDEMQIGYNDDNYPNQYPSYNAAMSSSDFEALKRTVSKESFDNSRLNTVKQAAANNYFSADQVRALVQVFGFENTKLDLAKYLYGRTVDKGNYFRVNDAFSYSSSKDELAKYIMQNP